MARDPDYFYGQQSEQYSFYRIPKVLFTDPVYSSLSIDAKLLYGLLLDRMDLSAKNGWFDEQGRVYIIFPVEGIMDSLGCASQKAAKLLDELEKNFGLIERRRRGMGRSNLIYVKNFLTNPSESKFMKFENQNSGSSKIEDQEVRKSKGNNTDINKTDKSDTDSLLFSGGQDFIPVREEKGIEKREQYRDYFRDQLDFDCLLFDHPMDADVLNELLELIVDTVCSTKKTIRIGGDDKPRAVVVSMFMKLRKTDIDYVLLCLSENTTRVKNMRQYLMTTIYNATLTKGSYYKARVNHDMAEGPPSRER